MWQMQMEEKYGCLRMVVLWLFSSLGGEPLTDSPAHILICAAHQEDEADLNKPKALGVQLCSMQSASCAAVMTMKAG